MGNRRVHQGGIVERCEWVVQATQVRKQRRQFVDEPLDVIALGVIDEQNLEIRVIGSLDEIDQARTKHVELAARRDDRGHPGRIRHSVANSPRARMDASLDHAVYLASRQCIGERLAVRLPPIRSVPRRLAGTGRGRDRGHEDVWHMVDVIRTLGHPQCEIIDLGSGQHCRSPPTSSSVCR